MAARRLRSESEHAADDRVLAVGTGAPDYAAELLAIAGAARSAGGAGSLALSMASHLEDRLLALRARLPGRPRSCLHGP